MSSAPEQYLLLTLNDLADKSSIGGEAIASAWERPAPCLRFLREFGERALVERTP